MLPHSTSQGLLLLRHVAPWHLPGPFATAPCCPMAPPRAFCYCAMLPHGTSQGLAKTCSLQPQPKACLLPDQQQVLFHDWRLNSNCLARPCTSLRLSTDKGPTSLPTRLSAAQGPASLELSREVLHPWNCRARSCTSLPTRLSAAQGPASLELSREVLHIPTYAPLCRSRSCILGIVARGPVHPCTCLPRKALRPCASATQGPVHPCASLPR